MRVLAVHSAYRQPGGEDASFEVECRLLRDRGHEVVELVFESARLGEMPTMARLGAVLNGAHASARVRALVADACPDVVYVNNAFPSIGPTAVRELVELPTVVAVRNQRFECLTGICFRKGDSCESCPTVGNFIPGVVRGCYRDSVPSSAVASVALTRTWAALRHGNSIRFACVSRHIAGRLMAARQVPASLIDIKPNTTDVWRDEASLRRYQVLVVGRLEPEKGIGLLLSEEARLKGLPLVFVGDGSLRTDVQEACRRVPSWQYLGSVSREEVARLLAESRVALVPSLWAESFGRVAVESLAVGTPVVVSDRGGLPEVVGTNGSGLVVDPTDLDSLVGAVETFLGQDAAFEEASAAARRRFSAAFHPTAIGERLSQSLAAAIAGPLAAGRNGEPK